MQVEQETIDEIYEKLTTARLAQYQSFFGCSEQSEVLGAYMWNKAIGSVFFPLLQATEVTLRNSIHSEATKLFSNNKEWFRMKRLPCSNKVANKYYKKGRNKKRLPINPPPAVDSVVSSLMFGFWVDLLTKNYDDPVNHSLLWPKLIPKVFPNAKGELATRKKLHQRFKFINDFRNRVSHCEPLWKIRETKDSQGMVVRPTPNTPGESIQRLNEYIELIIEAIGWMSKERYDFINGIGLVEAAKSVCTSRTLEHYLRNYSDYYNFNKIHKVLLDNKAKYNKVSGVYKFTTSQKGMFRGKDLILDIREISPPVFKK